MTQPRALLLLAIPLLSISLLGGCKNGETADASLVAHGQYIVHQVAMCIDCHSPRDPSGAFISGKDLAGAPLGFKPLFPMPWNPTAPGISGLPAGYTEETLAHYLATGTRPNNLPPTLPPMPSYRMSDRDAKAVAAYLASLASPAAKP